jgi:hypothetical protein
MFEFQFQGEFKKLPTSQVYIGVSFKRPVSMGIVQRAVVGAGLSWVKKVRVRVQCVAMERAA